MLCLYPLPYELAHSQSLHSHPWSLWDYNLRKEKLRKSGSSWINLFTVFLSLESEHVMLRMLMQKDDENLFQSDIGSNNGNLEKIDSNERVFMVFVILQLAKLKQSTYTRNNGHLAPDNTLPRGRE